jgi:uncharacterized protein YeaO (DUF488 family)
MNIYIAQYAEVKYDKTICPISISPTVPEGWKGKSLDIFFPLPDLVTQFKENKILIGDYTRIYTKEILDRLNPKEVIDYLIDTYNPKDVVICCWGTKDTFCHRYLVANWLNNWITKNPEIYNLSLVRDYKFRDLADESQR